MEQVTHLLRQSGLDPDDRAFDQSGNLLTFCGRWAYPLNTNQVQRQTTLHADDCTCGGCRRTTDFRGLPGNRR